MAISAFRRARLGILAAIGCALALAACADASLTAGQDAQLRAVFTQLRQGRIDNAEANFDPSYARPQLARTLTQLARIIPRDPPTGVRLIRSGAIQTSLGEGWQGTYEYAYPDRLLIVRTGMFRPRGGTARVNTFYIDVASLAAAHANEFTLRDRAPAQYAFLALAAAAPLITLIALITLARSLRVKRKLFWAAGMVVGLGAVTMNWTTGAIGARPLFADFFSLAVMRADTIAAPWMITVSLPLVALIFLALRLAGWPRPRRTLPQGLTLSGED